MLITGLIGFMTGLLGILIGMVSSVFIKGKDKRFKGTVLGFISGFMLAIVFFDLLPESFESGNVYMTSVGIILALILSVVLDGRLDHDKMHTVRNESHGFMKAALFMAIGIGIHNVPGGIALGSVYHASPTEGMHLAIALILHGLTEGVTIGIFLREMNASALSFILISVLTSVPMGLGAMLGGQISKISPTIICISLSFAAGMIIYITLRETLPSASDTWQGRMTTIGNMVGLVAGMLLVSGFHHH